MEQTPEHMLFETVNNVFGFRKYLLSGLKIK